jgi:hypothetical protein
LKESIISKKEIDTINYKSVYKRIKAGEQISYQEHSPFVIKLLKIMAEEAKDAPHLKFRVRAAIYLDYIVRFFLKPATIGKDISDPDNFGNATVIQGLLDRYADARLQAGQQKEFKYIKT